jgi:hypothetical protein
MVDDSSRFIASFPSFANLTCDSTTMSARLREFRHFDQGERILNISLPVLFRYASIIFLWDQLYDYKALLATVVLGL